GPLANLFSVELWERFSFYGMQGILAIYMYFAAVDGGLGIDETVALGIVGAYGGSVYLFSILGALVSDRLLGAERTLFGSAVMIMLGHIALALVPGIPGLMAGLLLVGVGSGGLKSTAAPLVADRLRGAATTLLGSGAVIMLVRIALVLVPGVPAVMAARLLLGVGSAGLQSTAAALVGSLYSRGDPPRDAGFSIYYMGINIGGLLGPLVTGFAQQQWGFHLGFGLAAIGMAVGLTQYVLTRRGLPESVHAVPDPLPRSRYPLWAGIGLGAVALVLVLVLTGTLHAGNLATVVAGLAVVGAIAIFALLLTSKKLDRDEHSRVVAFIPLFIGT